MAGMGDAGPGNDARVMFTRITIKLGHVILLYTIYQSMFQYILYHNSFVYHSMFYHVLINYSIFMLYLRRPLNLGSSPSLLWGHLMGAI